MSELMQVEAEIKDCEEYIVFGDSVEKLQKNKEFKKVIVEGYHSEEVARLVKALCKVSPEQRTEMFNRLLGISYSMEHLVTAEQIKEMAKNRITDLQEARSEILTEEV